MSRWIVRGGALAVLWALVQPPAAQADPAIRASYRCLGRFDAVDLTAFFFNEAPSEVMLLVGESATRLPRQIAGSGSRYAAADQEFWIKGDQAVWTLGKAAPLRCGPAPSTR